MLREIIELMFTPATPVAKKYGFVYQSISLKHRYERCKKVWLPHLKSCQDLFLQTVQKLSQKKSVVVLGSAHLHEIPMHLLLQNFETVTLVDVIHPLKHHLKAKREPRLKLVTQDLMQSLDKLDNIKTLEQLHAMIEDMRTKELFHFEADLIVSANLLSQLALLPMEALEKSRKEDLTIEEKDVICTAFAEIHLQNLLKCKGKKLIYSDREVLYHDKTGELLYKGHYPVNFAGFKKLKEWDWTLAPLKEASKKYSIQMHIEAYESED